MEYLIYPMKTISISQGSYEKDKYGQSSNLGYNAIDIVGKHDSSSAIREEVFAPATCKVLKIYKYNGEGTSANTVLFGTCDKNGNKAKVICADGTERVLTIACTHMEVDDFKSMGYYEGQIFNSGSLFYKEGKLGRASGLHVHLEIAEGWVYKKTTKDYVYYKNGIKGSNKGFTLDSILLKPEKLFFILNNYHSFRNNNNENVQLSGKRVDSREKIEVKPNPPINPTPTPNVFSMRVRSGVVDLLTTEVTGNKITTVPTGSMINIVGLYGWKAGDGYRWAWGKYRNFEGAFKYDPKRMTPEGDPTSNYKMILFGSAARLRKYPVNGGVNYTVPKGHYINILSFLSDIKSDGYQWCRGKFGNYEGYFQYDPNVMYPTND